VGVFTVLFVRATEKRIFLHAGYVMSITLNRGWGGEAREESALAKRERGGELALAFKF